MFRTRIIKWSVGKWSVGIGLAISVSVCWSLLHAGTIRNGRSAMEPIATDATVRPMPPAVMSEENEFVLRNIPTVSKPISVGRRTLVPYIGAGFGGGYATDFDRALSPAASASSSSSDSSNAGLRNVLGQHLIPNEVQLGIRFPF